MSTAWPAIAKTPSWEVTQPDVASLREPLLDLWRRNLPTAAEHRFDWLYGSGRARAWLLGEPNSAAMGAAGLMLRQMCVDGRMIDGGGAIDLNVDQSQRSVGPALALARAVTSSADREVRTLLFGMPNPSATAVMKRAGYRELGEFSSWTRLLRAAGKLHNLLRSKLASRLLAPLAEIALLLNSAEWRTRLPGTITAENIERFDDRFDALWTRAAGRFDVIGARNEDYLQWRFCSCPDLTYQIFTLVNRTNGELLGYLVWYLDKGSVSVSDMLAIDDSMLLLLLSEFSRRIRRTEAEAIRFWCLASPDFYRVLQRAGFRRRKNRHAVLGRWDDKSEFAPRPNSHWFLTMADSDTDV